MINERILRHPNGGALKIGTEVHVSQDSFCNYVSEIRGHSSVLTSTLLDVKLSNSVVFQSTVEFSCIAESTIAESLIDGLSAEGCILHRVEMKTPLTGQIRLKDVVAETCCLHGSWTLEGIARIPTGEWHRPPRFCHITGDNGVSVGLTESTDGHALMACWRKPIRKWIAFGPRLGRKHNWTEIQINAAKLFFEELLDVPLEP